MRMGYTVPTDENVLVFEWVFGGRSAISLPHDLQVDEQPVWGTIQVCEQTAILVCPLCAIFQVYRASSEHILQELAGTLAVGFHRPHRVDRLGRVYAYEPDSGELVINHQLDGVTVDDFGHFVGLGASEVGLLCLNKKRQQQKGHSHQQGVQLQTVPVQIK